MIDTTEIKSAWEKWVSGPIPEIEELRQGVLGGETTEVSDRLCTIAFTAGYLAHAQKSEARVKELEGEVSQLRRMVAQMERLAP